MDLNYKFDSNNHYDEFDYRPNDSIKSESNELNKYLNIGLSIERYV